MVSDFRDDQITPPSVDEYDAIRGRSRVDRLDFELPAIDGDESEDSSVFVGDDAAAVVLAGEGRVGVERPCGIFSQTLSWREFRDSEANCLGRSGR